MSQPPLRIAMFGSSIVSSYWNGACTYYRGIVRALHARGHQVTFFEPDAFERQQHRDIDDPPYAEVVVYEPTATAARKMLDRAADSDVVIKASGVGVLDDELATGTVDLDGPRLRLFWDVDAPATLASLDEIPDQPLARAVANFDLILTYGGGPPVVDHYRELGARDCVPIYNALDPDTHHRVAPEADLSADLSFLGNRLPDREARVREFFLNAAARLPERSFLLGGNGWEPHSVPANVRLLGHVGTGRHNALNSSALAVLNVNRESMAQTGFSPPTRVFEAAGAAACLISDAWEGIEQFLEPNTEVLVARDGAEVAAHLEALRPERARQIGEAAQARVLRDHTYDRRAEELEAVLFEALAGAPR